MESGPSTSTGTSTPRPQAQAGPIQQAPSNSSTKSSRAMEKEKADDRPKVSFMSLFDVIYMFNVSISIRLLLLLGALGIKTSETCCLDLETCT